MGSTYFQICLNYLIRIEQYGTVATLVFELWCRKDIYFICLQCCTVDLHRSNNEPDRDPIFHPDADPDPDPIPSFSHVGKNQKKQIWFLFTAALKISEFQYFKQFTEMFLKKSKAVLHCSQMDTDTDVLKWCQLDRIQIHTTACLISYFSPMYCYNSSSFAGGEISAENPQLGTWR